MSRPRVAVVILNWNDIDRTLACVGRVAAMDHPAAVIVVDNGSGTGSAAGLRALREQAADRRVTLLLNPVNRGYTGGCNQGIRAALDGGSDYVWLLNNDATAPPDTLSRLLAATEADPRIGLISPLVEHAGAPDACEFAGALIDLAGCSYLPTQDREQGRAWQARHPDRFVLTGTAVLARRALLERIGLLDERFFAYWEDTDYGLRSLRAGFRNHMAHDATISHAAKPAPAGRPPYFHYLMARNEILFWRKHVGRRRALRPTWWVWRRELALAGTLRPDLRESILAGVWDGLIGHAGGFDPARRMPWPWRPLLRAAPAAWQRVLDRI
jgi:GT2 family glycosyltransferase